MGRLVLPTLSKHEHPKPGRIYAPAGIDTVSDKQTHAEVQAKSEVGNRKQRTTVTPELKASIRRMHAEGTSTAEIARTFNISYGAARNVIENTSFTKGAATRSEVAADDVALSTNRTIKNIIELRQRALDTLTPEKLRRANAAQLSIMIGVLTDKLDKLQNSVAEDTASKRLTMPEMVAYLRDNPDTVAVVADRNAGSSQQDDAGDDNGTSDADYEEQASE